MGATTFAATYGTNGSKANASGKCVAKCGKRHQDVSNAAKTCKAQQADPNFASSHDGKTFDQLYGTNTGTAKAAATPSGSACRLRCSSPLTQT